MSPGVCARTHMARFLESLATSLHGPQRGARVRLATSSDLRALAAICRAAVGPDDYVLDYLPEMIADKEVLVTVAGGRARAMTGVTECADGALWIGQLRTHPKWRRRGFSRMLLDYAYHRVVREHRPALRLWTSQRNLAARELFESTGFRRVTMFTRMAAAPLRDGRLRRIRATRGLLQQWQRSLFGTEGGGYLDYRWRFTRLTPSILRGLAGRRELLASAQAAAVTWADDDSETLHVSVLAGGAAGLRLGRRAAGATGFSHVQAFVPRTRRSLAAARKAGFRKATWGTRALLYERYP